MQLLFRDDVVIEAVEIFFSQQLTGEEAWATETLEPTACWANARNAGRSLRVSHGRVVDRRGHGLNPASA
jgi:hypothetical protein